MRINHIKLVLTAIVILPFVAIMFFNGTTVSGTVPVAGDAVADYKAKCAMCHGQTAEKKFDATKSDDALIEVVLKGKADAKPAMPAYEAKNMTREEAAALVAHMKSLRPTQ